MEAISPSTVELGTGREGKAPVREIDLHLVGSPSIPVDGMLFSYLVPLLIMLGILVFDLSRKQFGHVTILRLVLVGSLLVALNFIRNHHPSWTLQASLCVMMLAPLVTVGTWFGKYDSK